MPVAFNGKIQGTAPDNSTLIGNPVPVAGVDGTGKVQSLLVAADGTLQVSGSSFNGVVTQPDQTLLKDTSYQGGTWNVGLLAGAAAIGSVTVSSSALPAGAATSAKQPALGTAGSASADVLTVQGIASMTPLKVDGSATIQPVSQSGTWTNIVTQAIGSNLHVVVDTAPTTAVTGTFWQATQPISASTLPLPTGASTAAKQPALGTAGTASTDVITVQGIAGGTAIPVSGTVTAANASVSATGSAVPASATMTGGTDGTNLRAILTDTSGRQVVNVNGSVAVTGTFFQATQPVSGTFFQATQPVSGTMTVTQATGTNLHVVVDSAPSTAVTGTVTVIHADTAPSTINITAADVASSTATGANSQAIITGTATANSAASFTISAQDTVNVQVTGTWVGTIQSEVSMDGGTTWYMRGVHQNGTNYVQSAFTGNLGGSLSVAGSTNFRMRCTAYTSGTATVRVSESINPGVVYLANSPQIADGTIPSQKLAIDASGRITANINGTVPISGTVTVNDQTSGLAQTKITDGTTVANVGPATGTQTGQTYLQCGGTFQSQAFTAAAAGNGTAYDVGGYASVKLQILTLYTGSSNISFQSSNDNTNWTNQSLVIGNGLTSAGVTSNNVAGNMFYGSLAGRYFRLVFSGTASSGNTTGTLIFSTLPTSPPSLGVSAAQNGTWTVGLSAGATVQPGNTANTTPWLVNALLNPSGTLLNTYSIHLTTNATTTPTASTAYISSITVSAEVAGTTSTVTIQDKQGTPLKLVNGLTTTALTTTPTTVNFQTPVKMVSGIDIITAGAVAATVDVWINYYQ